MVVEFCFKSGDDLAYRHVRQSGVIDDLVLLPFVLDTFLLVLLSLLLLFHILRLLLSQSELFIEVKSDPIIDVLHLLNPRQQIHGSYFILFLASQLGAFMEL